MNQTDGAPFKERFEEKMARHIFLAILLLAGTVLPISILVYALAG